MAASQGCVATQFTGDLAFGKDVKVLVRDVDRYGRTVGEVILPDGRSLNRELVRAGLAWWYRHYWLLLAESHLTRRLFGSMVRRIGALATG